MGKKGGGHHGGAWKVAYADFVTAMMALFLVLWITGQNKEILLATSEYFKNPFIVLNKDTMGLLQKEGGNAHEDKNKEMPPSNLSFLTQLAQELSRLLNITDAQEKPIDIEVTSEGVKVTLYDRTLKPVFESNSANLTKWGRFVLQNLAWLIERHKLKVVIDGHSAAGTKTRSADYGLWELTADRANAARRQLEHYAVASTQIERVAGYADTRPLADVPPDAESNQRLTISLSVD